mgnify:FL=1
MQGSEIFAPFFGMLLLTFVVWFVMYVRRLRYIVSNRVRTEDLTTLEKGAKVIPEAINWPAHNLRNLFELPVLFYALCIYLFATGYVDALYVASAWVFFAFRILHSGIHCTVNIVWLRFTAHNLGSLVLWFMVLRAAAGAFL